AGDRAVLRAREEDFARLLVDAMDLPHLPLARRDLPLEGAVRGEVVEVLIAVALGEHEEGAVIEQIRIAGTLDPRLRLVAEERLGVAPGGGPGDEVEPGLGAVLDVREDRLAVGPPADVADQEAAGEIAREVNPAHRAPGGRDDAEAHVRVRLAR